VVFEETKRAGSTGPFQSTRSSAADRTGGRLTGYLEDGMDGARRGPSCFGTERRHSSERECVFKLILPNERVCGRIYGFHDCVWIQLMIAAAEYYYEEVRYPKLPKRARTTSGRELQ
jgi:hypothetical protein